MGNHLHHIHLLHHRQLHYDLCHHHHLQYPLLILQLKVACHIPTVQAGDEGEVLIGEEDEVEYIVGEEDMAEATDMGEDELLLAEVEVLGETDHNSSTAAESGSESESSTFMQQSFSFNEVPTSVYSINTEVEGSTY